MTLEKIINKVKDVCVLAVTDPKTLMAVGAVMGMGYASEARGGNLSIYNGGKSVNINGTAVIIKHIAGATEGYDNNGKDSKYWNSVNPLQTYSYNTNCLPTTDKLSKDSKDPNSTTTYNIILSNNGFVGSTNNYLQFIPSPDNTNFDWKNIFFNINGDKKDIKCLINNGIYDSDWGQIVGKIELGILNGTTTGVYNTGTLEFFNHADLNRNKKVNMEDFAVFANEFGKNTTTDPNRFGTNVGSNPNDLGAYADIDRSGAVDYKDLKLLSAEWLWDANDPNTW